MDLQARYEIEHLKTAMATLASRVERVEEALSVTVPLSELYKGTTLAPGIEQPSQAALRLVEKALVEDVLVRDGLLEDIQEASALQMPNQCKTSQSREAVSAGESAPEAPQLTELELLANEGSTVPLTDTSPALDNPKPIALSDRAAGESAVSDTLTPLVSTRKSEASNNSEAPNSEAPNSEAPSNSGAAQRPSLELEIGLYWLNRLGITSLVIGVALFLMYSFQYFGPVAKIATGLMVAIGLLFGGEWMERKGGPKWYARSLMGGGWSLAYFTVFAMYHIPSVKVIDNFNIDWLLLNGVTIGAMWHCVSKRSEWTAMLALVLGLVTFGFSEAGVTGAIATAVLVESLCVLSHKLGWSRLYFWGLLGAYGTFHIGMSQKIRALELSTLDNFWMTAAYLLVIWAPFLVTSLMMKEEAPWRRQLLVAGAVINVLAFVPAFVAAAEPVLQGSTFLVAIAFASIYAVAARLARLKGLNGNEHVYLLSSLSLLTAAVPMKLHSNWMFVWWLAEIPLLSFLGLTYRLPIMRFFANFMIPVTMACTILMQWGDKKIPLFNLQVPEGLLHLAMAITAYMLTAMCYRMWRTRHGIVSEYSGVWFYIYFAVAGFFAWLLPLRVVSIETMNGEMMSNVMRSSFLVASWILQPVVALAVGLALKDRLLKRTALVAFAFSCLTVVCINEANFAAHAFAAAIVYGVAALVRSRKFEMQERERRFHFRTYIFLASLLVWSLTQTHFQSHMTMLLSLEAAATLALGMWLKDSFLEGLGAIWFVTISGVLLGSLGHWDLLQTGVLIGTLYCCSYAYRRLNLREPGKDHRLSAQIYEAVAALIVTLLVKEQVPANCLAFAWSLQGLLLLALGFLIQDKLSRFYGLAIFALVGGKLLLIDLAGAETLQRILSFIVAGVVLLIASYAYSIFERRFGAVTRDDQLESESKLAA